jgi:CubicO group peptidase (beta-lactamase class C family)
MKPRERSVILAGVLLAFLLSCTSLPRQVVESTTRPSEIAGQLSSDDAEKATRANDYLVNLARQNEFRGSVLIAHGGNVLVCKGFGFSSVKDATANSARTKFKIGSVTKQFTAAAIMQLRDQGKLGLRDPVSMYIKDCPGSWAEITLFHLLTHTSGIHSYTETTAYATMKKQSITPDELVKRVSDFPLDFVPGESWHYSNSGYAVLGRIVEVMSGESYGQYLSENIFKPLGMKDTGYAGDNKTIADLASGYTGIGTEAAFVDMSVPFSAGGLYSTVVDLYLWDQALYSEVLLPRHTIEEMTTSEVGGLGIQADYGFGWGIGRSFGRRLVFHGGGIDGFRSEIDRYVDDRLTVIVLSNREDTDAGAIARRLAEIVLRGAAQ